MNMVLNLIYCLSVKWFVFIHHVKYLFFMSFLSSRGFIAFREMYLSKFFKHG